MMTSQEFAIKYFAEGQTDFGYLHAHYSRFTITKSIFESQPHPKMLGKRMLDIGAHWLHQSLLWRESGYDVVAADVGLTLDIPWVREQAQRNQIELIRYARLDDGQALASLADESIDVVLFCEILEHITFNPMAFWSEVYRVLAPGGRIVVTTPNYYWLRGRAWDIKRLRARGGGGLPVQEILRTPTYGHHWKEFALRECVEYFNSLSEDFVTARAEYVCDPRPLDPSATSSKRWQRYLEDRIRLLRWGLHIEVEKTGSGKGMAITPSW
jgi:2-polyprenyl-3-methyl-5-hydroxy-6-metoxy-1,4-benzoquinol methylase